MSRIFFIFSANFLNQTKNRCRQRLDISRLKPVNRYKIFGGPHIIKKLIIIFLNVNHYAGPRSAGWWYYKLRFTNNVADFKIMFSDDVIVGHIVYRLFNILFFLFDGMPCFCDHNSVCFIVRSSNRVSMFGEFYFKS